MAPTATHKVLCLLLIMLMINLLSSLIQFVIKWLFFPIKECIMKNMTKKVVMELQKEYTDDKYPKNGKSITANVLFSMCPIVIKLLLIPSLLFAFGYYRYYFFIVIHIIQTLCYHTYQINTQRMSLMATHEILYSLLVMLIINLLLLLIQFIIKWTFWPIIKFIMKNIIEQIVIELCKEYPENEYPENKKSITSNVFFWLRPIVRELLLISSLIDVIHCFEKKKDMDKYNAMMKINGWRHSTLIKMDIRDIKNYMKNIKMEPNKQIIRSFILFNTTTAVITRKIQSLFCLFMDFFISFNYLTNIVLLLPITNAFYIIGSLMDSKSSYGRSRRLFRLLLTVIVLFPNRIEHLILIKIAPDINLNNLVYDITNIFHMVVIIMFFICDLCNYWKSKLVFIILMVNPRLWFNLFDENIWCVCINWHVDFNKYVGDIVYIITNYVLFVVFFIGHRKGRMILLFPFYRSFICIADYLELCNCAKYTPFIRYFLIWLEGDTITFAKWYKMPYSFYVQYCVDWICGVKTWTDILNDMGQHNKHKYVISFTMANENAYNIFEHYYNNHYSKGCIHKLLALDIKKLRKSETFNKIAEKAATIELNDKNRSINNACHTACNDIVTDLNTKPINMLTRNTNNILLNEPVALKTPLPQEEQILTDKQNDKSNIVFEQNTTGIIHHIVNKKKSI